MIGKHEAGSGLGERHGDGGRDAALWLGRCAGRLRLAELGRLVGNLDYAVVSKDIARFEQCMRTDPQLREQLASVQLQTVQMTNAKIRPNIFSQCQLRLTMP